MPAFEDICQYLLQSGPEQTVEKVKTKLSGFDLSFLHEEEEDSTGVDAARKGIEEVALGELNVVVGVVEKEALDRGMVEKDIGIVDLVEGGQFFDPIIPDLVI